MRPPQTLRACPPPSSSRLSFLQLSAEAAAPSSVSSAASAEPLPAARGGGCRTTFSRRRGPAGACAPPGPTRDPRPGRRPPTQAPLRPCACPAPSARWGRRSVSLRRGRHPWVQPSASPRVAAGGARAGAAEPAAGRAEPPAAATATSALPGHRGTAGPAPLREGWAPGDPAGCPPLPASRRGCLPASQNGVAAAGGALRGAGQAPAASGDFC